MALNIFELFGKISISTNNAKDEIDEITASARGLATQLGITDTTAGKSVGKGSKLNAGVVWLGNTATQITNFIGRSVSKLPGMMVEAAAEVNAKTAAFNSTYGELSDTASATYKRIGEETNILETRLRSVGTKGFSQLKGAGLSAIDSLTESERVLRMAADAAAYYDISLEDADARIRSFMRVNVEAGDAIGLFTSEGQRNAAAMDKYGQKFIDLTEAQKQLLLLDITEDIYKSNGVLGQASRESMEYANVTANAAEAGTLSLATFGTQINNSLIPALHNLTNWLMDESTQEKLGGFAETLGNIAAVTFDEATSFFQWITENGEAVGVALSTIAVGLAAGAIAAHPYAAAVLALAAALAALSGGKDFDSMYFDKYTQEDLEVLQRYVDAWNRLNELEAQAQYTTDWRVLMDYSETQAAYNAASKEADAIEGLKSAYRNWLTTQGHTADMPFLDVPLKVADEAESAMQTEIGGMSLEAVVKLLPDASQLSDLSTIATGEVPHVQWNADGAIFNKPTLFNTPLGFQGVGEAGPEAVAPIDKLQQYVSDAVRNTVGDMQFNIVLDSGTLVGQLAPQMDAKLGKISGRKGRGN